MSDIKFNHGAMSKLDAKLKMITRSARVKRYHSEPVLHQQTVGEHTYGVLWFILMIANGRASAELLRAAVMHDMHEYITGDVPSPSKRLPGVKEVFDGLEADIEMTVVGERAPILTAEEAWTLKTADCLDGLTFCAFELRLGNREIEDCFRNYLDYGHKQFSTMPESLRSSFFFSAVLDKYAAEFLNAFGKDAK